MMSSMIRLLVIFSCLIVTMALLVGCHDDRRPRRDSPTPIETNNPTTPDAGNLTDTGTINPSDPCNNACSSDQVCVDGACQALPSGCPCPSGSYCNLSENRCVAGCLGDEDCGAERICDTDARQCIAGCNSNADCSGGKLCRLSIQECVDPCQSNASCNFNEICGDESMCQLGMPCGILFICLNSCDGDAACETDCQGSAPQDAKNKHQTFRACYNANDCDNSGETCIQDNCQSEADVCFDGYWTCDNMLACILNCEDQNCGQICAIYTSNAGRDKYDAMISCAQTQNCSDYGCIEQRCPTQWNACLND